MKRRKSGDARYTSTSPVSSVSSVLLGTKETEVRETRATHYVGFVGFIGGRLATGIANDVLPVLWKTNETEGRKRWYDRREYRNSRRV